MFEKRSVYKKIGFLGISTTVVRISAGIVGGILAGYVIRDYLRRNRIEDKNADIRGQYKR